ncbi:MAG: GTPase HflX [Fluviibacter sp.]|jgi:GTP-binding protein HflX|nr:GTPase HflX [Rhodocyclales bacterium]
MTVNDPALAGLSDPRLARKSAQSRSAEQAKERVLIVQVNFGDLDIEEAIEEVRMLAESAGAEVADVITCRRDRPDVALFVGSGKAEEIGQYAKALDASLVIFNHSLSPVQQRNLEQVVHGRVIDRTSLILDIFALRAQSAEGKLQVELAQLEHLASRLIRGWTHLERQRGGIGMRGPGETQLETDRRLIGTRVKMLKERLARLAKQRRTQGRARSRQGVLTISLVGYTNAGKSTLFNALTHSGAYAADQLFATLDTTVRRVWLPEAGNVVVADTVGFIRDLPHTLVEAFKATLETTTQADLLLHVIDAANPAREQQIAEVNKVLAEIGASHVPQIRVYNKCDLTAAEPGIERDPYGKITRVRLSAQTGAGLPWLRAAIAEFAHPEIEKLSPDVDQ